MSPVCRKQAPDEFAQFHIRWPRMRAWMFCRVNSVGSSPPSISRVACIAIGRVVDRDRSELDAQFLGQSVRRRLRPALRMPARHVEGGDERRRAVADQCRGAPGHEQRQHRIASARERDAQRPKRQGLLVTLHAQRKRLEQIVEREVARIGQRCRRGQEEAAAVGCGVGEAGAVGGLAAAGDDRHVEALQAEVFTVAAPGRVLHPQPARAIEIDDRGGPRLAESRCRQHEAAVLEHHPAAVKGEAILPADGMA